MRGGFSPLRKNVGRLIQSGVRATRASQRYGSFLRRASATEPTPFNRATECAIMSPPPPLPPQDDAAPCFFSHMYAKHGSTSAMPPTSRPDRRWIFCAVGWGPLSSARTNQPPTPSSAAKLCTHGTHVRADGRTHTHTRALREHGWCSPVSTTPETARGRVLLT